MSLPSAAPSPDPRGPTLLAIAREAIERPSDPDPFLEASWLRAPGASFVTLRLEGELRGCIGTIEAHRPLGLDVAHNGRAAAYRDPRFPPVTPDELRLLEVEVSVLSPQEPFPVASEAEAIARLRPGVDGVCFGFRELRSTFLPQVWEGLPHPAEFLAELKRKAGLPRSFWHPDVKLTRYTVEKFR